MHRVPTCRLQIGCKQGGGLGHSRVCAKYTPNEHAARHKACSFLQEAYLGKRLLPGGMEAAPLPGGLLPQQLARKVQRHLCTCRDGAYVCSQKQARALHAAEQGVSGSSAVIWGHRAVQVNGELTLEPSSRQRSGAEPSALPPQSAAGLQNSVKQCRTTLQGKRDAASSEPSWMILKLLVSHGRWHPTSAVRM